MSCKGFQWQNGKIKIKSICNGSVQEQAVEKAEHKFQNLDLNGNGEITEDEFIKGCLEDDYFITTLERARRQRYQNQGFYQDFL